MPHEDRTKPEIIHKINANIMKFPYYNDLTMAPGVHQCMNSLYMQMLHEIHNLRNFALQRRKEKILELYIQDYLREEKELAEVGYGFTNTQP